VKVRSKTRPYLLQMGIDDISVLHGSLDTTCKNASERVMKQRKKKRGTPPRESLWVTTAHHHIRIVAFLRVSRSFPLLMPRCGSRNERTRVFAKPFLGEGGGKHAQERSGGEGYTQTSATSNIFLNCMFALTFTVTSGFERAFSTSGLAYVNGGRR
jgi:hypothetical protein